MPSKVQFSMAGIITDHIGRHPAGQVKREIVGGIGNACDKAWLCKDYIRPTLFGIIEKQDFCRKLFTIDNHGLDQAGLIRVRLEEGIDRWLARLVNPDCDRCIIIVRDLRWLRGWL